VWNLKTKHLIKTLQGQSSIVNSLDISKDGRYILSGSDDTYTRLWDIKKNKLSKIFNRQKDAIRTVGFSGNEKFVVAGSGAMEGDLSYSIKIYNKSSTKSLKKFRSNRYIKSISISTGRYIAIALEDSYDIKLWDSKRNRIIKIYKGHMGQVNSVAIDSQGSYILSGSDDNSIKMWSRKSGKLLHTFKGHTDAVTGVAFSRNRDYFISSSRDKSIRVWDRKKRILLKKISVDNEITAIAISDNGRYIVSVTGNRDDKSSSIELWDRKKGSLIQKFQDAKHTISSVQVSNDGNSIFSTSDDAILVWDRDKPNNPIKKLIGGADGSWVIFDYKEGIVIESRNSFLLDKSVLK
jgi:WD40 repeat protein